MVPWRGETPRLRCDARHATPVRIPRARPGDAERGERNRRIRLWTRRPGALDQSWAVHPPVLPGERRHDVSDAAHTGRHRIHRVVFPRHPPHTGRRRNRRPLRIQPPEPEQLSDAPHTGTGGVRDDLLPVRGADFPRGGHEHREVRRTQEHRPADQAWRQRQGDLRFQVVLRPEPRLVVGHAILPERRDAEPGRQLPRGVPVSTLSLPVRPRMKLRVVNLLLAAGIAILFTSCKEGNVYYTLENEVKVEDLSLPNDITLFDVTKIGTSYYAAAGKIWTVADTAAEWDINATITPPVSGGICTALVASPFGATLYGGFIHGGGNLGLYESTAAPGFSGLSAVSEPTINGAQIALLKTINDGVNDWLVAVTARHLPGENFTFGIAAFNNLAWGTFDTSVRVSPEDQKPFNDIIWSTNFSRWYATSGPTLYTKT